MNTCNFAVKLFAVYIYTVLAPIISEKATKKGRFKKNSVKLYHQIVVLKKLVCFGLFYNTEGQNYQKTELTPVDLHVRYEPALVLRVKPVAPR